MMDLSASTVIQGGSFLLVAWLFIQIIKVSLPDLISTFKMESEKQRDLFKLESETQRHLFSTTLEKIEISFVNVALEKAQVDSKIQRNDFRDELSKQRHALINIINQLHLENQNLMQHLHAAGVKIPKSDPIPNIPVTKFETK